jgi:hypothetical protein
MFITQTIKYFVSFAEFELSVWNCFFFSILYLQVVVFSYQEVGPDVYDCWATFIKPWGERVYVTW